MPSMSKTIFCWMAAFLLSASSLMGKPEYRTWSVTFEGGWQGSLMLNPTPENGVKSGGFFWLFEKRDIRWDEDAETITIIYRRPQNPLYENPPKLRFRKNAGSLVPMPDGLDAGEYKALAAAPWKPGGPDPGQLGGYGSSTPYSKAHKSGDFILDVSTLPEPLARHALRVFDDDKEHLLPLIRHPGFSAETLNTVWKDANDTWKEYEHDSRRRSIMMALATNPSIPKELLGTLWNETSELKLWDEKLFYLVSRHPSANPEWYAEVLKRLAGDDEKSDRLRASLSDFNPLPVEVLDLLVRHASTERYTSSLAYRKDLSPAQIETLFLLGWSDRDKVLVSRADFPPHLFEKAATSASVDEVLIPLAENKVTPPAVVQQVLRRIYDHPEFYHGGSGPFGYLEFVAGHHLLPADLQPKLAAHIAPEVRMTLAGNPSLTQPILRQLAADPFACVAEAARKGFPDKPDGETAAFLASLPALDTLKPEQTFYEAATTILAADDPATFRLYQDARPERESLSIVESGAIRCLRDQMALGNLEPRSLAAEAFTKGWTAEMTELALGKNPDTETVEAFALAIVQKGKAEDFESLEKRNVGLGAIRKSPLVWYAVARKDEAMLKRLASLHADPGIPYDGLTPVQLAVRARFMPALDILPVDEASRTELEAFHKRFPGDSKAAWLGNWTNGKSEFKTIGLQFRPDGTGTLLASTGMGIAIAWVQPEPSRPEFEITAFDDAGKEEPPVIKARLDGANLVIRLEDRDETFVRAKPVN
jgi:hypothetical protein